MRTIFFLCILLNVLSCKDDDSTMPILIDNDVVGTWRLIATYADPGDGSGDFQVVESNKSIQFLNNGAFVSNANLCVIFSDIGEASAGVYSEEDATLTVSGCDMSPVTATYEINESGLIVSYFCIEGCREKYVKIQ